MLMSVSNTSSAGKSYNAPELSVISYGKEGISTCRGENVLGAGFGLGCLSKVEDHPEAEKNGLEAETRDPQGCDEGDLFGGDEGLEQYGDESDRRLEVEPVFEGHAPNEEGEVVEESHFANPAVPTATDEPERKNLATRDEEELISLKGRLSAVIASSKTAPKSDLPELKKEGTALAAKINKIRRKTDLMLANLPIPYEKERRAPRERRPFGELSPAEKKRKREEAEEDWKLDTEVLPSRRAARMKKVTDVELMLEEAGLVVDEEVKEDLGIVLEENGKKRSKARGLPRVRKGGVVRRDGEMWAKRKPHHALEIQKR